MEEYNRILIPTDGSDEARHAALKGISLAKLIGAKEVIALYVKDFSAIAAIPMDEEILLINSKLGEEGKEAVEFVKEEGKKMGVKVEPLVVEGTPAKEIIDIAEERKIDIIVMGTLGRTGLERLLLGSVAEKVIRHAPCPVFVVRYTKYERDEG